MSPSDVPDHPATGVFQKKVTKGSANVAESVSARKRTEATHVSKTGVARFNASVHTALPTVEALPFYRGVDVRKLTFINGTIRGL